MYKHIISLATLLAVLAPIGVQHAIAYPSTPPSGGYSGGIFSQYFRNIIEGDGSMGSTSSGICPAGEMIGGFDTSPARYGMPICVSAAGGGEVLATGFSGTLMGTENYVTKYAAGGSGLTNSRFFDNGLNIGLDTLVPMAKLDIVGNIRIADGTQGSGKVLVSDNTGIAQWQHLPADLPVGAVMAFNSTTCPAGWAIADGVNGPDLRGEFIRGLDNGRGVDTGRILGSGQRGSLIMSNASAGTDLRVFTLQANGSIANNLGFDPAAGNVNPTATYRWNQANGSQGVWGVGAVDSNFVGTTRPRNVALLYCIKVTSANAALSSDVTWMNMDGTTAGNVVLATTGNVGVGTTTPTSKLDIVGEIRAFQASVSGNIFANAFYYNSDRSLKKNITEIEKPLDKLGLIHGYVFKWKESGRDAIGVIAQEVEEVFPEIVSERITSDGIKIKTVDYASLIAPIVAAVNELNLQIRSLYSVMDEQKIRIDTLEAYNRQIQSENRALMIRLENLEKELLQR